GRRDRADHLQRETGPRRSETDISIWGYNNGQQDCPFYVASAMARQFTIETIPYSGHWANGQDIAHLRNSPVVGRSPSAGPRQHLALKNQLWGVKYGFGLNPALTQRIVQNYLPILTNHERVTAKRKISVGRHPSINLLKVRKKRVCR